MPAKASSVQFIGGEDLISPADLVDRRLLHLAYNYDPGLSGGYTRLAGYERYDGQPSPSAATGAKILTGSDGETLTSSDGLLTLVVGRDSEDARALIQPVPGAGPVTGVQVFEGKLYAFRDNVAQTAQGMYAANPGGWSQITIPARSPGGRFEFHAHNFYANTGGWRLYGCDGVNPGFEFDGATMTEINSATTPDTPTHVVAHHPYLFFSYPGGFIQHSDLGTPLSWTGLWDATQYGIGEEITALKELADNLLAIMGVKRTHFLTGLVRADYAMQEHSIDVGSLPHTALRMGDLYFMDRLGITSLTATQAFGKMKHATLSLNVDPYVKSLLTTGVTAAMELRKRNLMRFFAPGATTTRFSTMVIAGKKSAGFTRGEYPFSLSCVCDGEIDGVERYFAGAADGYVYELEAGINNDGAAMTSIMKTHPINLGNPLMIKRWRQVWLQCKAVEATPIKFRVDYAYEDPEIPKDTVNVDNIAASGGAWGINAWDEFVWDGRATYPLRGKMEGSGENVVITLSTSSAYHAPHQIYGMMFRHSNRRLKRN